MSTQHPSCPNDPRPRCAPPPSAVNESPDVGDGGVSSDAGEAGTESPELTNAAKVVSAMRPRFRDCYMDLLKRTRGAAEGSARLTFHINCEGYVSWISAMLDGGLDEGAARCLITVAKDARFDPPLRGWADVRIPVYFQRATSTPPP